MNTALIAGNALTIFVIGSILAYFGWIGHVVKRSTYHHMIHVWKGTPEEVSHQLRIAKRFEFIMWMGIVLAIPSGYVLWVIVSCLQVHDSFSTASPTHWEMLWGVLNLGMLFALAVTFMYVVITSINRHNGWTR